LCLSGNGIQQTRMTVAKRIDGYTAQKIKVRIPIYARDAAAGCVLNRNRQSPIDLIHGLLFTFNDCLTGRWDIHRQE